MKRITVGRGNDCDIVIIDETDNVSRHHLVITFDFLGKMKVSDTSSNGTSINGTRMLKGTSIPVTREDRIRLGRNIELDWNLVKDPYRTVRITSLSILSVSIAVCLFTWLWVWYKEAHTATGNELIEMIGTTVEVEESWNKDSTAKVAPTVTAIDVKEKKKSSPKESSSKRKEVKKVNSQKEKEYPDTKKDQGSELDSIAVF